MKHSLVTLTFNDGKLDSANSDLSGLPKDTKFEISESNGFFLQVPKDSSLSVLEIHYGEQTTEFDCTFELAQNSSLDYLKWKNFTNSVVHNSDLNVEQSSGSNFSGGFFSFGGANIYQSLKLSQIGEHAKSTLYGFCEPVQDNQEIKHEIDLLHAAPFGTSDMFYKGILSAKSKSGFRGRVKALKEAKSIEAHQANHYLLLSKDAEARSCPELEIYQEDIKCSHGATVGQIDDAALFYLRSRGIPYDQAKMILQKAFVQDIVMRAPQVFHPWFKKNWGYFNEL